MYKFQFTIFDYMITSGLFIKYACFVAHQRNYHFFHVEILLNPTIISVSISNITYLLRESFKVTCLVNIVLNLSSISEWQED